jgi:hypothetical protein
MSPKNQMKILKIASSLAFSLVIGATYKLGKQVDEKITEHFTDSPEAEEQND